MIQGGTGTSSNMNANEMMANRALEILGKEHGQYDIVHPNNHLNLSQSTNDVLFDLGDARDSYQYRRFAIGDDRPRRGVSAQGGGVQLVHQDGTHPAW